MHSIQSESDQKSFNREVEILKGEVVDFEAEYTELIQRSPSSSSLSQKLGRYFGFDHAEKLNWALFKLKLKQGQLASFEAQPGKLDERSLSAGTAPAVFPLSPPIETARQKMERMITENPPALEPHIRHIYQTLIEAEA
jgi:hypothetical protein